MKISYSAAQAWLTCGWFYYLTRMLKIQPQERKSALAFGDAIDTGLNTLLETRSLDGAIVAFETVWEKSRDKDIAYSKADLEDHLIEEGQGAWESLLKKGIIILEEYNVQVMPNIKEVIAIQLDRTVRNDDGDEIQFKTDLIARWIDDRIILFDNKTTSVKYGDDSVRTSEQLATYWAMLKEEFNLEACGYIVIPKRTNKQKLPRIKIEVVIDDMPQETIDKAMGEYDMVLVNVKEANFPVNHGSCWGKYGRCDMWDHCKKRKGL